MTKKDAQYEAARPQNIEPDEGEREESAIPKDYQPDPYPAWLFNENGVGIVVDNLAEAEQARAEGFDTRVLPPTTPAPKRR